MSEIARIVAADLEADATNAATAAGDLARIAADYRRLVGLEKRVNDALVSLRRRIKKSSRDSRDGFINREQSKAHREAYRDAIRLIARALAGTDDDTTSAPSWLTELAEAIEADPNLKVVSATTELNAKDGERVGGDDFADVAGGE